MTVLRGHRCDQCKTETYDYQPHGWRRLEFSSHALRPGIDLDERADVCSDECETDWWNARIKQREELLKGTN